MTEERFLDWIQLKRHMIQAWHLEQLRATERNDQQLIQQIQKLKQILVMEIHIMEQTVKAGK